MKQKFFTWLKAAGIRAIRTAAQTALSLIGCSAVILSDVNWSLVISGAALAAILSLLMSIAGLPELEEGDHNE